MPRGSTRGAADAEGPQQLGIDEGTRAIEHRTGPDRPGNRRFVNLVHGAPA
jgi:hypothetical protein